MIWYMIWFCLPHSQRCDSRFLWNNTLAWCMSYDIDGLVVGCVFSSTMCWRCHGLWRSQRYDMIWYVMWYGMIIWYDVIWYGMIYGLPQSKRHDTWYHVTWHCVVWCGVWCHIIWYMIRYIWYSIWCHMLRYMIRHIIYGIVWCGMTRYGMIYDVMWCDKIWLIWYDMIWYDMIWYDTIQYDTVRYGLLWNS